MISWKSCDRVSDHLNQRRTRKPCAIAHENDQKCLKSGDFHDFLKIVWWGFGPFKSTTDPKTVCYSPRKRLKMLRNHEFFMIPWKSCDGVPNHLNPRQSRKPCAISHENGQKCLISRDFHDFVKIVWRSFGPFKSTSDPKTLCYNPRKRPEMPEIRIF